MPIIPEPTDPVQEERHKRELQKQQALKKLTSLAGQSISLKRHVFFVPGWTGEEGKAWREPYPTLLPGHGPIKAWIDQIVRNPDQVTYVSYLDFSVQESMASASFFEFGEILKKKVRTQVSGDEAIDLIGHSMGGLDILAAVTQGNDALMNVENCVTVASPLRGVAYAKFIKEADDLLPFLHWEPYHHIQVRNMGHHCEAIAQINSLKVRTRLLQNVRMFNQLEGTQDMTVMRNARLRTEGLAGSLKQKIRPLIVEGASHSGATGITQDPRTILYLISIIADIPIQKPSMNRGFVYVKKSSAT